MNLGKNYDLGLSLLSNHSKREGDVDRILLSHQLGPPAIWESQMAVKRAAALLSNPKLEDEGSESTSQHEGPKK